MSELGKQVARSLIKERSIAGCAREVGQAPGIYMFPNTLMRFIRVMSTCLHRDTSVGR